MNSVCWNAIFRCTGPCLGEMLDHFNQSRLTNTKNLDEESATLPPPCHVPYSCDVFQHTDREQKLQSTEYNNSPSKAVNSSSLISINLNVEYIVSYGTVGMLLTGFFVVGETTRARQECVPMTAIQFSTRSSSDNIDYLSTTID